MTKKKHTADEKENNVEGEKPERESDVPTTQESEGEIPAVIPEGELSQLRSDLDEALAKANEYLGGWQRERAEFYNYKKRMEREISQGGTNAFGSAIRRYLAIADDLARALKNNNRPADGDGAIWPAGIDLIYRKLIGA